VFNDSGSCSCTVGWSLFNAVAANIFDTVDIRPVTTVTVSNTIKLDKIDAPTFTSVL
jgi:hypothetical protein